MRRSRGLCLLLNPNGAVTKATLGCRLLLLIGLLLVNHNDTIALLLIAHIVVLSKRLLRLVERIAARAPASVGEASYASHRGAII